MRGLRPAAAGLLAAAWAAAGCQPAGVRPPRLEDPVDRVLLQVAPAPVNRDDEPGADGVELRVFFWQEPGPKAVAVAGAVTFVLYEGRVRRAALDDAPAARTWEFQGSDLTPYLGRRWGQLCYSVALLWPEGPPAADVVTVAARYRPASGGPAVWSDPALLQMRRR